MARFRIGRCDADGRGLGLAPAAAFHLLPLALDAGAIVVLFYRGNASGSMRDALLARWAGEFANSLLLRGAKRRGCWL